MFATLPVDETDQPSGVIVLLCQLVVLKPPRVVVKVIGRFVRFALLREHYFATAYLPFGVDEGDGTDLLLVLFCSYGVTGGVMMLVFVSG